MHTCVSLRLCLLLSVLVTCALQVCNAASFTCLRNRKAPALTKCEGKTGKGKRSVEGQLKIHGGIHHHEHHRRDIDVEYAKTLKALIRDNLNQLEWSTLVTDAEMTHAPFANSGQKSDFTCALVSLAAQVTDAWATGREMKKINAQLQNARVELGKDDRAKLTTQYNKLNTKLTKQRNEMCPTINALRNAKANY